MSRPRGAALRSPLVLALIGLVVVVAIAGAAGLAYLFLRPAPPAAVGLATAAPGSGQPAASIVAVPSGAAATLGPGGVSGTWTVDQTIGRFADFSDSFVGYRVDETLAQNRANTAVGRTAQVTGTLTLDGTSITSVEVTADLTRLTSDDDRRDGQLHQQALETDVFPQAMFKLTAPIDLGAAPVDGQAIAATATGQLTLHGVTKTVQVPIQALLSGDIVTVTGSLEIQFANFQIQPPVSFAILSIEDHGTMEFQLHFRHD